MIWEALLGDVFLHKHECCQFKACGSTFV